MKLSASGVEPTFSQGKATYLTIGLLGQLNISTNIKKYEIHEMQKVLEIYKINKK
ncbi:hypothetical protein PFFVO_06025 [Plasmodium falciparum Vietnam Oak-Knoll (FVO)]|uniref:Uncharacterized protein n=1 Tax=Plasmodium falciparum Vietnam Oak-Knoll (FVO) TaxID=1036723 RepID=A0A024UWR1_PLAFA|nr:hypothetical protein PFFVO_06025 [Plasmodium falciparum Vietnam Oak-Knoll (FVO)]